MTVFDLGYPIIISEVSTLRGSIHCIHMYTLFDRCYTACTCIFTVLVLLAFLADSFARAKFLEVIASVHVRDTCILLCFYELKVVENSFGQSCVFTLL